MAPNKLENQIKEKLNSREIQPSAQAWDRLDAMLSVAENKKPKRKINWLAIAAVFVGFIILGTIFINKNKEITTVNENVVLETPKVDIQKKVDAVKSILKTEPILTENQIVVQKTNNPKPKIQNLKHKTEGISIIKNNQNQITSIPESETPTIQNQKILETNSDEILLSEKAKNQIPKSTIKICASSLLSQVDGEITTEFRENVFTKVSKNFQTVKVALAERNNTK